MLYLSTLRGPNKLNYFVLSFDRALSLKREKWKMYSSLIPKRTPTALERYYHGVYKYEHAKRNKLDKELHGKSRKGARQTRGD